MTTEETRTLVRTLYEAYAQGDGAKVATLVDDDIDWIIHGPVQLFPFMGPRRGKAEVLETLAGISKDYTLERYEPIWMVVDGDRAAVQSKAAFTQRSTNRRLSFNIATFLRVRDGRIVEFVELSNTFDLAEQALGRWLAV
jgi:ketosteroid isomerase-like protein